jgi:pimeloyl-ACP methyl ester carboxylesterase
LVRSLWHKGLVVSETVTQPTLVVWGERDPDLDLRLLRGLERWVSCFRIERIQDAGHWVHLEAQTQVNDMMIRFLKEGNRCIRDRLAWVE